ncbi:hypothetical protein B0A55_10024 [Friedmanniomyces simplex]|uniref:Uncharacterized protein n=1 Tax=Friedmanniomyces simplex TaxID=329884 RepID=A0A4V5NDZ6_9PEZI|nr:hypothetical protein B0A55_10024 [Friedmanniomyces simplex]
MLIRLVLSILDTLSGGYGWSWGANQSGPFVLGGILGFIGLLSVGWSLATIGEAQGERTIFGVCITRMHFDIFIYVYFVIHVVSLITWFFGLYGGAGSIVWNVLWVLIIPVSVVATMPATYRAAENAV